MRKYGAAILCFILLAATAWAAALPEPEQVIERFDRQFSRFQDAFGDITLDAALHLFGCSGNQRFAGKAYFKAPDKIRAELNGTTYFARANDIRKIESNGKRWYVKLINALDFHPGFNPRLIPFNFKLKTISASSEEVVIAGWPKPSVLKNVKQVNFHFDKQRDLLTKLDIILVNERLNGVIDIDYELIDGVWTPTGFKGRSAIELRPGILVGLDISLKGSNIVLNQGISDEVFNPGF
ncbi:MAG: hypothetical protein JW782_06930 [Candidatus Saganbacteria bacterium]|nr:hypothetical protein [Candidatus Saganbacteria bacterium]